MKTLFVVKISIVITSPFRWWGADHAVRVKVVRVIVIIGIVMVHLPLLLLMLLQGLLLQNTKSWIWRVLHQLLLLHDLAEGVLHIRWTVKHSPVLFKTMPVLTRLQHAWCAANWWRHAATIITNAGLAIFRMGRNENSLASWCKLSSCLCCGLLSLSWPLGVLLLEAVLLLVSDQLIVTLENKQTLLALVVAASSSCKTSLIFIGQWGIRWRLVLIDLSCFLASILKPDNNDSRAQSKQLWKVLQIVIFGVSIVLKELLQDLDLIVSEPCSVSSLAWASNGEARAYWPRAFREWIEIVWHERRRCRGGWQMWWHWRKCRKVWKQRIVLRWQWWKSTQLWDWQQARKSEIATLRGTLVIHIRNFVDCIVVGGCFDILMRWLDFNWLWRWDRFTTVISELFFNAVLWSVFGLLLCI